MRNPRTVLDLYRLEADTAAAGHYVHVTPAGRSTVTGDRFFELAAPPALRDEYATVVGRADSDLARHEETDKLALLPTTLSGQGGHPTPTMTVKRRLVEEQLEDLIDDLYEE